MVIMRVVNGLIIWRIFAFALVHKSKLCKRFFRCVTVASHFTDEKSAPGLVSTWGGNFTTDFPAGGKIIVLVSKVSLCCERRRLDRLDGAGLCPLHTACKWGPVSRTIRVDLICGPAGAQKCSYATASAMEYDWKKRAFKNHHRSRGGILAALHASGCRWSFYIFIFIQIWSELQIFQVEKEAKF